jgi:hypothetical protein
MVTAIFCGHVITLRTHLFAFPTISVTEIGKAPSLEAIRVTTASPDIEPLGRVSAFFDLFLNDTQATSFNFGANRKDVFGIRHRPSVFITRSATRGTGAVRGLVALITTQTDV